MNLNHFPPLMKGLTISMEPGSAVFFRVIGKGRGRQTMTLMIKEGKLRHVAGKVLGENEARASGELGKVKKYACFRSAGDVDYIFRA